MEEKREQPEAIRVMGVYLTKVNAVYHGAAGERAKLSRKNRIDVVSEKEGTITLRLREEIAFEEPRPGPFELSLEVEARLAVNQPLGDEEQKKKYLEEVGAKVLLPYSTAVIASITQKMRAIPLILPPRLEKGEH